MRIKLEDNLDLRDEFGHERAAAAIEGIYMESPWSRLSCDEYNRRRDELYSAWEASHGN